MAKFPLARVDLVIDLFQSGVLCNCNEYDDVFDEDRKVIGRELRHVAHCVGRVKARELLADEAFEDYE